MNLSRIVFSSLHPATTKKLLGCLRFHPWILSFSNFYSSPYLHFQMHTPLLRFSNYLSNHFFFVSIRREKRATRSIALDFKPGIPFSALIFGDVGYGRSPLGGFASMAFSGGNGGFGKSDGNSAKGGDGEDENSDNLVGCWSLLEDTWKDVVLLELCKLMGRSLLAQAVDPCGLFLALPFVLICKISFLEAFYWIILSCILSMVILAAALGVYVCFYCVKGLIRGSEENASNPPDNVECCICLSTYEDRPIWHSLPCNHWFHSACINSWVQINPTCPICKRDAYRRT